MSYHRSNVWRRRLRWQSGGQKQRVGLARAVYEDADVYLLDDPLSAVDAHTGAHIMEHCILGRLRERGKTVVLPCHALSFLDNADWVVVLGDDGAVAEQGLYRTLLERGGGTFAQLMEEFASVKKDDTDVLAAAPQTPSGGEGGKGGGRGSRGKAGAEGGGGKSGGGGGGGGKNGKLMQVEERAKGTVNRSVYVYYAAQCGKLLCLMVLGCYISAQLIGIFKDWCDVGHSVP